MQIQRPEFIPHKDLEREEMIQLQNRIADNACFSDRVDFRIEDIDERIVVGVDQAFLGDQVLSAAVVFQDGEIIEKKYVVEETPLPYIPGLLAFREGHAISEVLRSLDHEPDLLMIDGSGRIHFRQAGIATHIGVIFDKPAIGVAKKLLCGTPEASTDTLEKGEKVAINADNRVNISGLIGYAVQTKQYDSYGINPVYVSPGHRLSEESASAIALTLTEDYKLPIPVYEADSYVTKIKGKL